MQTANLTDALLDYWTARAEKVPAADLEFRANGTLCVSRLRNGPHGIDCVMVLDYSTNWALTGPLVEKHHLMLDSDMHTEWQASVLLHDKEGEPFWDSELGPTAMIAICRAVVRATFGDEVEDLK